MEKKPSQIRIFNRNGSLIKNVRSIASRSWVINEFGRAYIPISTIDQREFDYLINAEYGNYVYITHDDLPPWGGMIYLPRPWQGTAAGINAYSGEFLLKTRRGHPGLSINGTPGNYFATVINYLVKNSPMLLRMASDYYKEGVAALQTVTFLTPYEYVTKLAADSGMEFSISPIYSGKRLSFEADWHLFQGTIENFVLQEGVNIEQGTETILMTEDGDIINDVTVYSSSSKAMTAASKQSVNVIDKSSTDQYGLFQGSISVNSTSSGVLKQAGEAFLRAHARPTRTFNFKLNNVNETFKHVRLGNIMKFKAFNIGYNGSTKGIETYVRVTQMAYDDISELLEVICNEVI